MTNRSSGDDAIERRLRALGGAIGAGSTTWTPAGGRAIDGRVLIDSLDGDMQTVRSTASLTERQLVVQAGEIVVALDIATIGHLPIDEPVEDRVTDDPGAGASNGGSAADRAGHSTAAVEVGGPAGAPGAAPARTVIVRGQVLSGTQGAAVVQFVSRDGVEGALTSVDDLGEFEIEIAAGEWVLVVADDAVDVSVVVALG